MAVRGGACVERPTCAVLIWRPFGPRHGCQKSRRSADRSGDPPRGRRDASRGERNEGWKDNQFSLASSPLATVLSSSAGGSGRGSVCIFADSRMSSAGSFGVVWPASNVRVDRAGLLATGVLRRRRGPAIEVWAGVRR